MLKALSQLNLYRMQERANQFLAEGQIDDASRQLHNLATQLFSQGHNELARTALQEAENIEQLRGLSETGKKVIKYGTRSLLLPAGVDDGSKTILEGKGI
jgi:Ca-activated chloride channel family protein